MPALFRFIVSVVGAATVTAGIAAYPEPPPAISILVTSPRVSPLPRTAVPVAVTPESV